MSRRALVPRLKGAVKVLVDGWRLSDDRRDFAGAMLSGRRRREPERTQRYRHGGRPFEARPADWCTVTEIAVDREYGFVDTVLPGRDDPVVVDVGANIGLFALDLLARRPAATVHSYEPRASTFAVLRTNRELNADADWTVHHAALADADGRASLLRTAASTASRLDPAGDEQVTTVGLATVLEVHVGRPVDLLKVDAEGAEERILAGNERWLERVGALVVEVHPDLCDEAAVRSAVHAAFPHVHRVPGRASSKPLVLAAREPQDLPRW